VDLAARSREKMEEQTSQDAVALEKRAARAAVRAAVSALTPTERALGSAAVCQRVMGTEAFAAARVVMVFAPLGDEVDLERVVDRCRETGRRVCAARTDWDRSLLEPAMLTAERGAGWSGLARARYGLREPPPEAAKLELREVDLVLVPGVAFDRSCHRLGRGGGFYDRFLSRPELSRAYLIGVGFGVQVVSTVPRSGHDRPVHAVVTDREVIVGESRTRGRDL
jgi:5-formyltetrahydrofolate cyclo-ligase